MLYPQDSETRERKDISGVWQFKVDRKNEGYKKKWYQKSLQDSIPMPVPASYNDITQDITIRDHIGDVWYEQHFFIPEAWKKKRVIIRVGSATHRAVIWVNGNKVAAHQGGYMPFEADISTVVNYGKQNRVTICVNNVLEWSTIPPGYVKKYNDHMHPKGFKTQEYFFDFFNFSGIHRPVLILALPKTYISDIKVVTDIKGKDGIVHYEVKTTGSGKPAVRVTLIDENGKEAAKGTGAKGTLKVKKARLWQPRNAYLYTLRVDTPDDTYRLQVGIRTIKVTDRQFLINGKPFYFKGCCKHEDMDIKGRGLDNALNIKDINLLKWAGSNSFRASHYPYSEEILNLADREGLVVIAEAPAAGMNTWSKIPGKAFTKGRLDDKTLKNHLDAVREMVQRDKNHPSVVMWSLSDEARTQEQSSVPYFKKVINTTRKLDPSRPITIAIMLTNINDCKVTKFVDVMCLNRYYGWYWDPGQLEISAFQMEKDFRDWYKKHKMPIICGEFGVETIAGLHQDPPVMFSEEYQCEFFKQYCKAFDKLDYVVGEFIWNFADFATNQGITRAGGNKKGIFTRQRQPKAGAHFFRERWHKMK